MIDLINHPPHYTAHPSGYECLDLTKDMGFCLGNALKYAWRANLKNGVEDYRKAVFYLDYLIERPGVNRGHIPTAELRNVARAEEASYGAASYRSKFFRRISDHNLTVARKHLQGLIDQATPQSEVAAYG